MGLGRLLNIVTVIWSLSFSFAQENVPWKPRSCVNCYGDKITPVQLYFDGCNVFMCRGSMLPARCTRQRCRWNQCYEIEREEPEPEKGNSGGYHGNQNGFSNNNNNGYHNNQVGYHNNHDGYHNNQMIYNNNQVSCHRNMNGLQNDFFNHLHINGYLNRRYGYENNQNDLFNNGNGLYGIGRFDDMNGFHNNGFDLHNDGLHNNNNNNSNNNNNKMASTTTTMVSTTMETAYT